MDNSLVFYKQKVEQMIDVMRKFSSSLNHHVIIEPRNTLEVAVGYGFPSDIATHYLSNYYSKNIADAEEVMKYIETACIPYLSDVAFYIESAMNRSGGNRSSSSGGSSASNMTMGDLAMEKNNRDLENALGIKQGPKMSVAEADMQNANPHLTEKYVEDPDGDYVVPVTGVRYRKNPAYNPDEEDFYEQFTVNCATCATAYALRLRGFDVIAKGNVEGSGSLNEKISDAKEYNNVWKNEDGSKVEPVHTDDWMKKNGIDEMSVYDYRKYFEEVCEQKGVYVVMVRWIGDSSGHATILQRDEDGILYYIEPQRYQSSKGADGRRNLDDLLMQSKGKQKLSIKPSHGYGVLRVDDKLFNVDYADLFETK